MIPIRYALFAVSLLMLTGCHRVILVAPGQVGPIWFTAHDLVWQGRAGKGDFIIYVPAGMCKQTLTSAVGPVTSSGVHTFALPTADRVTCTLARGTRDTDFPYYIGFIPAPSVDKEHLPPPPPPTPPADTEGPFAVRVGRCQNC